MVPAGIGILYFAVFMTWSGVVYETCTQGATENIVFGAVITAPLYVAGLCLSVFGRPGARAWYWSVPLWPIAVLVAYGAATLFVHTNIHGDALCNWRTGYDDYDPAGETNFAAYPVAGAFLLRERWGRGRRRHGDLHSVPAAQSHDRCLKSDSDLSEV